MVLFTVVRVMTLITTGLENLRDWLYFMGKKGSGQTLMTSGRQSQLVRRLSPSKGKALEMRRQKFCGGRAS